MVRSRLPVKLIVGCLKKGNACATELESAFGRALPGLKDGGAEGIQWDAAGLSDGNAIDGTLECACEGDQSKWDCGGHGISKA